MRPAAHIVLLGLLAIGAGTASAGSPDLPLAPCLERTMVARERHRVALAWSEPAAWPGAPERAGRADFVIVGHETLWDANGVVADGPDTLIVPRGARVRWHRAAGLHTITDGRGLGDPLAGARFDYLLDEAHASFDTTFGEPDTIPFFCAFHDPGMRGVLVISANAGVDPDEPPSALRFSSPPFPNPTRGVVRFAVGLPESRAVTLDIRDVQGRRIATLHRGDLEAGEHTFRWRGTDAGGGLVRSGVYVAWLSDGRRIMARRFTLLR